jgi:hypothetical protein
VRRAGSEVAYRGGLVAFFSARGELPRYEPSAMDPLTDEEFARTVAHLLEVKQNGHGRPATPADVLEFFELGPARYVLRGAHGYYLGKDLRSWVQLQSEAYVLSDVRAARIHRRDARAHGIVIKIARIRRRGTCGLEAVRFRDDVATNITGEGIEITVPDGRAIEVLAALMSAKEGRG